jgi:hypothetical protein
MYFPVPRQCLDPIPGPGNNRSPPPTSPITGPRRIAIYPLNCVHIYSVTSVILDIPFDIVCLHIDEHLQYV